VTIDLPGRPTSEARRAPADDLNGDPLLYTLSRIDPLQRIGRVAEARGTLLRATGVSAVIGELCELRNPVSGETLPAEVVGVERRRTLLTPLGALDGISVATEVRATGRRAEIPVHAGWLGRVIDAHGRPIDGRPLLPGPVSVPVHREAPAPMARPPIDQPFGTGVRALDTLLSVGVGQRLGIFAAAGGGKSTLLGMLARHAAADVNVIVLVGERGREVREFIDDCLGEDGLRRSVLVVATSDRPALERCRAADVGTAVAEYFRDQGLHVLLMMDSVTRYARALRDVALAVGEPPARRGFPPSVLSRLPQLFERTGRDGHGAITAFYTVLVEDEDAGADPIAEEVRSILDGHIVLSRKLGSAGHYPAIDVLASVSRVMSRIATATHRSAAQRLRQLLAKYQDIELLLQIGEYKSGTDPEADAAIRLMPGIQRLLRQSPQESVSFEQSLVQLRTAIGA